MKLPLMLSRLWSSRREGKEYVNPVEQLRTLSDQVETLTREVESLKEQMTTLLEQETPPRSGH